MKIKVQLTRDENLTYYNGQTEIEIDIEEYLKGVVPAEVGNALLECGKAQAVAARTFALNKCKKTGKISDKSSTDQAFRASRFSSSYARAHQAVEETRGQVLFYDGTLITNANYSASNGGRTMSAHERWGGKDLPYLISRDDPWDTGKKTGHGVGLSQRGAKYAASIGIGYKEILDFYYPGTEIRENYGEAIVAPVPAPVVVDKGVTKTMDLTNTAFVEFLKQMVGQPYWYGTCVYKCTSSLLNSKTNQYPSHYTSGRMTQYKKNISDKKVCADCVGLGKGFVWTNGGEGVIEAIGNDNKITSHYGKNGCPDQSANGMFTYAKSHGKKYGTIATIPEVPGVAVRKDGHVGYYIGNGEVVEAEGFNYGIVITKLSKRPWTDWYEFPGIDYSDVKIEEPSKNPVTETAPAPVKPGTTELPDYELGQRTLRKGSKGTDVKELQELLMELDYQLPKYGADGDYGTETQAAIKLFQTANHLTVDGICGPNTFQVLLNFQGSTDTMDTEKAQDKAETSTLDYSAYPTVRRNDKNSYVTILQTHLKKLGYNMGAFGPKKDGIDGSFGYVTQTAVRAFQKAHGLKVDGIVGKATWAALAATPYT